jgi:hypothetical protein
MAHGLEAKERQDVHAVYAIHDQRWTAVDVDDFVGVGTAIPDTPAARIAACSRSSVPPSLARMTFNARLSSSANTSVAPWPQD